MPRALPICSVLLTVLLGLSGCGSDESAAKAEPSEESSPSATSSSPAPTPSATASATPAKPAGSVIEIKVSGDDISPEAKQVKVKAGEKITFRFDSDRAGELHVHSTPAKYVEFGRGTSQHSITLRQPGVVDVEEHESGQLLVRLQVR